jgi:hypothetical protein
MGNSCNFLDRDIYHIDVRFRSLDRGTGGLMQAWVEGAAMQWTGCIQVAKKVVICRECKQTGRLKVD